MTKHTILFLAANPSGTDPRALDREARSIRAELKRSGYRDRFDFETRWAAEPLDLLRELRKLKPTVVHFSGHSGQNGLFFQAADGRVQVVSPAAIAETFSAAGASVKLVVLSACYSEAPAEALLAHVDCVVGVGGSIHDDAARSFAIGFYGALGDQESVAAACRHGSAAISLEGLPDAERPQLKVRDGFDATQLVLAAVVPSPRVVLPCPYPGMRPYSADDADHLHGRAAEIDELLGRLRAGEREIYVIGPSGSGKSSLVAAGVLPRLASGVAGLGPFLVRSMRPGEHPAARLGEVLEAPEGEGPTPATAIAALLAHRAAGAAVLLVIDQLEELFTLSSAEERAKFLDALRALRADLRCVLVLVLRADFYGALMDSPLWADLGGQVLRVDVAPLRGPALREAIERPARDLGVSFEPGLVEQLLGDAASEPGILPLLQETLNQLWDHQQQRRLTLADYQALSDSGRSGLAVAISHRADVTLHELTSRRQAIARRILLRLVSFGEGRSDTRRQQPLAALRAADDRAGDLDKVVQQLVGHRLLTIDDGRVDLAHEVMIAAWPTLAGWIQTHRADEQHRRQLEAAAAHWVERGRGALGLLEPIEQAEAEAWQRTESARALGQSADVAALVGASKTAHDRQRRRRRGLVWSVFAALAVVTVVVATLAVTAHHRAIEAEANRKRAEASDLEGRRLLAQSYKEAGWQQLLGGHPQEAMPYLMAARRSGEKGELLRMLIGTATRFLPLIPILEHDAAVSSAAFSADGSRVVTASSDHTARVWDAATGKPLGPSFRHQEGVNSAAFNRDGSRVVTASSDRTAQVWDAVTGKPLGPPLQHQGAVWKAAFSPDGSRVVTASDDKTARIWDAATGQPLGVPLQHQGVVWSVAFSPDGTRVITASWDKTARVWDATTGNPLTAALEHQDRVSSAAFSPDSTRIVTASWDATARVWDTATGKPLATPLQHQLVVRSAVFSPDGTRIVTASSDRTAQIWDAATGKPLGPRLTHPGSVRSAAFSPDGTHVVTASWDKTARVWDAATGKPIGTPLEHQGAVNSAAFSPDGTRIVTTSDDNTARVWDATTGRPLVPPFQHQAAVYSAAFSPDGMRIITASDDNTARIWETPLDETAPAEWSILAARSPFVLSGTVHVRRVPEPALDSARSAPTISASTPGASRSTIAESIPQPLERRAEPIPFAPGQIWSGHYVCSQGRTSLALQITSVRDNTVDAVFAFSQAESGASGSHLASGQYDPTHRRLTLASRGWIRQPPGYTMVDLTGTLSADGSRFAGSVSTSGCSTFSVRHR
jgi:WD40 repeat protein